MLHTNMLLIPWLMKIEGPISHSQALFNNPYPESKQFLVLTPISLRSILILSSNLLLGLHKGLHPACVPVNFESTPTFFHSSYMTSTSLSSRLNQPDYIR